MPELDLVAVSQKAFLNRKVVDVSPIDTAQVHDLECIAIVTDFGVPAGDRAVGDVEIIGWLTADGKFRFEEREDGSFEGSGYG